MRRLLRIAAPLLALASLAVAAEPAPFSARVTGSGPPVLLIPGSANGPNVWDGTVARLKGRYECHVLTLAGFAGQPAIGEPFLPRVRDGILSYIRERKLRRPVLIGHSLGGWLAFWVAVTAPDQVGPIVSVDGPPFLALGASPEQAQDQGRNLRAHYAALDQESFAREVIQLLRRQLHDPKEAARVAEQAVLSDPKAVAVSFSEVLDLRPKLKEIRTPVLLFGQTSGAADPAEKERLYRDQLASVPSHKLVMAPRAGHYIQLDEPDAFHRELEAFLLAAK